VFLPKSRRAVPGGISCVEGAGGGPCGKWTGPPTRPILGRREARMRRETKTWAGRVAAAAVVAFVLAYVPYCLYTRSGLGRTLALSRDLKTLRARNQELAAENDRLAREAE